MLWKATVRPREQVRERDLHEDGQEQDQRERGKRQIQRAARLLLRLPEIRRHGPSQSVQESGRLQAGAVRCTVERGPSLPGDGGADHLRTPSGIRSASASAPPGARVADDSPVRLLSGARATIVKPSQKFSNPNRQVATWRSISMV